MADGDELCKTVVQPGICVEIYRKIIDLMVVTTSLCSVRLKLRSVEIKTTRSSSIHACSQLRIQVPGGTP
jgi:hypothetical protein